MGYATRGDLLIAAGHSIKMQEMNGITPVYRFEHKEVSMRSLKFDSYQYDYEFPLGVIEGKLVWGADTIYNKTGHEIPAKCHACELNDTNYSWNPPKPKPKPKPKTITIELTVEDAEEFINLPWVYTITKKIAEACKKSLGELK